MQIRVKPSDKNFTYVFGNTITMSNKFLEEATDKSLSATYYHELGHIQTLKMMVILIIFSTGLFLISMMYLPVILQPLLLLIYYIVFCRILRVGEYLADEYALQNTDLDSMKEFLKNEATQDNRIANIFYFFRWHPSVNFRYKNLIEVNNRCMKIN